MNTAPDVVAFIVGFGLSFLFASRGVSGDGLPTWIGLLFGAITAYALSNLAGIRKVATADQAARTAALAMAPPPGKALIYLYREGFVGMAAGLNVAVDGKTIAQLTSPRFTCCVVSPGPHTLSAAFGGLAGPQNRSEAVEVMASPASVHVYRLSLSLGALKNTIKATPVTDLAAAKATLGRMKMTTPDLAEV